MEQTSITQLQMDLADPISLSRKEHLEIIDQAHWLHRSLGREDRISAVSLPAPLVCRILDRTCRWGSIYALYCRMDTDEVSFGTKGVWKTGGRKVCEFVLSHTTEEDLLLCNWTLELMHREHFNAIGQDPGDCQETFYRDGKQMDRDVLLAQAEELFGPLPKKEWET